MPPPPRPNPPAHTARVALSGSDLGGRWVNVFWIRNGSKQGSDSASRAALAKFVYDSWLLYLGVHVNMRVSLLGAQLLYYGDTDVLGGDWVATSFCSLGPADNMPAQTSTGISWLVPERYRGGHPRTYLPPAHVSVMTDPAHYTQAFVDSVAQSANAFHTAINGFNNGPMNDMHLGTVSFVLHKAWRTPPVFRDFTPGAASVDARLDTQRRRLGPDIN